LLDVTSPLPPPICYGPFSTHLGKRLSVDFELETRRKRLLYRSVYRGNKENDILLGQFARAHIAGFGSAELDQYEMLLQVGDNDIYDWVAGKTAPPPEADTPVLRLLMAFRVRF
jgi:antitoxin CptB